ncbi:BTAD domain-containing putative transcriptional regulator [Streptomyces sp. bgisy095]|uniref:BTAD domain-containing putative transcriptional regulator n=1 Tax=unclassified Streptomyces TaxID=2593676 RepID=UPI003D738B95
MASHSAGPISPLRVRGSSSVIPPIVEPAPRRRHGADTAWREFAEKQPLDDPLQALRIRALRDTGRAAEALAAHEEVGAALAERLGTDPGPELRAPHTELLTDDRPVGRLARAVVDVETLAHLVAPYLVVARFGTAAWARGGRGGPGDAEAGARFLGAYDAHAGLGSGGFRPFTPETEDRIRTRAEEVLRGALTPETYARPYEEGAVLSLRAAADLVRQPWETPSGDFA